MELPDTQELFYIGEAIHLVSEIPENTIAVIARSERSTAEILAVYPDKFEQLLREIAMDPVDLKQLISGVNARCDSYRTSSEEHKEKCFGSEIVICSATSIWQVDTPTFADRVRHWITILDFEQSL